MLRGHDWSTVGVIGGISNVMAVVAAVVVGKATTYACVCVLVCVYVLVSISVSVFVCVEAIGRDVKMIVWLPMLLLKL